MCAFIGAIKINGKINNSEAGFYELWNEQKMNTIHQMPSYKILLTVHSSFLFLLKYTVNKLIKAVILQASRDR